MQSQEYIDRVFKELSIRCQNISESTIGRLLKGWERIGLTIEDLPIDDNDTPTIKDVLKAFRNFNCAILTAFRGGFSLEGNIGRNKSLKSDMENLDLYYRPVMGCYREADWEVPNIEYCYFVFQREGQEDKDFFSHIYRLSEKYEQDSFLYKRAGINKTAFLIATNDAGRAEFKDDIHFTGQLYLYVPDVNAWTDCKDGRFSFQLKGMILINTGHKKIKLGEGNLFDVEDEKDYAPDGLAVIRRADQSELKDDCKNYDAKPPLVQHVFLKDNQTEASIRDAVFRTLKKLRDKKCKKIGFHCSAKINGSATEGAKAAYEAVVAWAQRFDKWFKQIVIVDIYGDYSKIDK